MTPLLHGATTGPGPRWCRPGVNVSAWPRGASRPPSAACIESPSVQTTAVGGPERGDDGGKKSNGRKRHLVVDTLGVVLAILMTSAGRDDGVAAPRLLGHVTPDDFPRLVTLFADQKSHHHALDAWMAEPRTGGRREVQARPEGLRGFTPRAKRWVIARTNAWNGRYRRNRKDDERSVEASTAMIQIGNIHLMLNRLAPGNRPAFHYRKNAA
jgi:putative transposase